MRPPGRPLRRRHAGRNDSELVGSAERANLEDPAYVRPPGSQRAPRPRASSGAMGPPSLGWTPPRGPCPPQKARHPLTAGDGVGPAWPEPRRSSCPCPSPGAPRIAGATALPARRSSSTPARIRRRRFIHLPAVLLCSQEARRLAQHVQDRSAGRDFLDGGETAGAP